MFEIKCKKDDNAVREELSYAFLHAVVGHARGSCSIEGRGFDAAGVDASCLFEGEFDAEQRALRRVEFGVQLKATSANEKPVDRNGRLCWPLSLELNLLEKYAELGNKPLFLVLFRLPTIAEFNRWLAIDEESATLRKCAYWTPLAGLPVPTDKKSSTIYVPTKNVLTSETIVNNIVVPLANREELRYETL